MLGHVREGDVLHVHEISRLARNTADLLALVKQLTGKGVTVVFKKEALTFSGAGASPMNELMLTMLAAVAAFELAMITERRVEGQAKAREAGKHMGRSAKLTPKQVVEVRQRAADGENRTVLAEEYGISRATLYAVLKAPK
jgi:DNA invertase Pin-like site-specific DNA recombinase